MTEIKGLRIVVAEDDDLNLLIVMKTLEEGGHIGIEFEDGDTAWQYLREHPIEVDMVILDKMMLRMHGLEVVKLMKEHEILKRIPIIIQTGDAYPDKIKEAVDAGIDCYITKPFEGNDLLEVIQDVAARYKLLGRPAA